MFMRPAMEADLQAIKKIYMEAFPWWKGHPFSRIIKQWRSGELDILTFREEDNSLIGFSINASEADLVLIDYLAISPAVRGGGYGSKSSGIDAPLLSRQAHLSHHRASRYGS